MLVRAAEHFAGANNGVKLCLSLQIDRPGPPIPVSGSGIVPGFECRCERSQSHIWPLDDQSRHGGYTSLAAFSQPTAVASLPTLRLQHASYFRS